MAMTVSKAQAGGIVLERNAPDNLRKHLRGELILPGSPGYDESRSIWNAMIDRRPAVIVRPVGVPDIATGIQFAREQGLPLTIESRQVEVAVYA